MSQNAIAQTQYEVPDVEIKPRKMSFAFSQIKSKYWFDNNSILTSFFSALSATFPPGEASFIESVRYYRDNITDPELSEQIRGFIGQEGHHSHQHKQANQALEDMGLHVARLEEHFTQWLDKHQARFSPAEHLASTVCLEHLTAVMAEFVLNRPDILNKMPEEIRGLIAWHAVEEIEHKAVAFDVYMQEVGSRKMLHKAMRIITVSFIMKTLTNQVRLHWWDKKIPSLREIRGAYQFMLGKRGMMREMREAYREFYDEDFHPWQRDNTDLIEHWKKEYAYLGEA